MMIYKNTIVCSPDEDTNFFNIVTGFLQADTLALFFVYYLSWLRTSIDQIRENDFTLKNTRGKRYPTETITDGISSKLWLCQY